MLTGLADLGHAYMGFLNITSIVYGLGGALIGSASVACPGCRQRFVSPC